VDHSQRIFRPRRVIDIHGIHGGMDLQLPASHHVTYEKHKAVPAKCQEYSRFLINAPHFGHQVVGDTLPAARTRVVGSSCLFTVVTVSVVIVVFMVKVYRQFAVSENGNVRIRQRTYRRSLSLP